MKELRIGRITSKKDYEKIAELIYSTDLYLYKDLFGNIECAKKVLPILLDDPRSVFYKDNYYLALLGKNIVGISALYKNTLKWNDSIVRNAFYEVKCKCPESFDTVSKYFWSVFDYVTTGISACNITVLDGYRNKGVGTFLLEHLIMASGNATIDLNVIADNEPAVKLYAKHGFKVEEEYEDYGGFENPPVRCLKMSRKNKKEGSE